MPTEAIDPPGITWLRVSPKYMTVRLVEWALGNLIAVALLSLPLVLVLAGWWRWPPRVAGHRRCRQQCWSWPSGGWC